MKGHKSNRCSIKPARYSKDMNAGISYKGKRVLVTGNTGFSGIWLSTLLSLTGAEVFGYSRDQSDFSTLFPSGAVTTKWPTAFGDVCDSGELENVIKTFDPHIIFHLAAQSLVLKGYDNPLETFMTNAIGTLNVLQSATKSRSLEGVLIVTTDKVYAEGNSSKLEDSKLGGSDPYSCSKVAAEEAVSAFRQKYRRLGVPICVVRGGNIIGGGDWSKNRLVPDIVKSSLNKEALLLRFPQATRPWQHVLDLVYAYALIGYTMTKESARLADTEFNVGPASGVNMDVRSLVDKFRSLNWSVEIKTQHKKLHEATFLEIDSRKIQRVLGWHAGLDLEETIEWTSTWYTDVLVHAQDPMRITANQVAKYLKEKLYE